MSLENIVLENKKNVVSKDVDRYLEVLGFNFRFVENGTYRCEYYTIIQIGGCDYKITFMSETELYMEKVGIDSSGRVNVWHMIFELFESRDILEGTKTFPIMTSDFLKSEEFNRAFDYIFKYRISK